jgi:putative ABC transport system permease protein
MGNLLQNVRQSFRIILKNPGFAAIAILTLGLGIGACTAIFSIVDAVLLRSLPYPEPDRLVQLREVSEKGTLMAVAEPNFLDIHARSRDLEAVALYAGGLATVTGGREPVRARTYEVSADFFRVLGVQPLRGRTFAPDENRPGSQGVAVLSYGFWQRALGGKDDLAGARLRVDEDDYTVIGVMPPSFDFPREGEIWVLRKLLPPQSSRSGHNWSVIARLREGASIEQARAEMTALSRQLKQEHGSDMDAVDFALIPRHEYVVGDTRGGLLIILVAVGFLLLVACTNVANLLLARVTARQKEFAVRAALGGTRFRLAQQFITENLMLALPAGALGALLSYWGVGVLIGLNKDALPRAGEIGVDARALAFTLGLSLMIAIALALVPVIRYSGEGLYGLLKQAGRAQSPHGAGNRLRSLLVVSQVALTLTLLIGAGLLGRSFYRILQNDPGFRVQSVVSMDLSLPWYNDPEGFKKFIQAYKQLLERGTLPEGATSSPESDRHNERLRAFHKRLLERVEGVPGAIAVGSVNLLPMAGQGSSGTFLIDNNPSNTGQADYRLATPGYFTTMGIPLLAGRMFDERDRPETPQVALISQSLAEKYWPNESPIGRRIQFGGMDGDLHLMEVVGIVGDVRDRGLDSGAGMTLYAHALQRPHPSSLSVVIRTNADMSELMPALREAVNSLNPELPMSFRTLEQVFSSSLDQRRFSLVIFAAFAAVALALAVMGVYGVMSYAVTQRTQEIGIRIALGAQARDVIKLVVLKAMALTAIGIAIGVAAAYALTRLMESLLYGVSATDPVTFLVVPVLLAGAALAASYIPARRATRVDPVIALRYE